MAKKVGASTNETDTAVTATISIDSTTAIDLLAAQPATESARQEIIITPDGNKALWVRKRAASSDNLKDGIRIPPGDSEKIVRGVDKYRGPISAIYDSGGAKDVFVEVQ